MNACTDELLNWYGEHRLQNPVVSFFVRGVPRPGGSKRAFVNKKTGKAVITGDNPKTKDWMRLVSYTAAQVYKGSPIRDHPIRLKIIFVMLRPKSHYRTGKNSHLLRDSAPTDPTGKPDLTKLLRSTEDALKGIVWHDDSQVVNHVVTKVYGDIPGASVVVECLGEA